MSCFIAKIVIGLTLFTSGGIPKVHGYQSGHPNLVWFGDASLTSEYRICTAFTSMC